LVRVARGVADGRLDCASRPEGSRSSDAVGGYLLTTLTRPSPEHDRFVIF
jgi:hypothetical protein